MTTQKVSREDLRKQLDATLGEVESMRDDLRVRTHLMGMELKARWDALERRALEVGDAVRAARVEARDDAFAAARDALGEVRKGLAQLRTALEAKRPS